MFSSLLSFPHTFYHRLTPHSPPRARPRQAKNSFFPIQSTIPDTLTLHHNHTDHPAARGAVTTSCNIIGAASVQIYPRKAIDVLNDFSTQRTKFIEGRDATTPASESPPSY
jgi:hypothetical protein